MDIPFVTVRDFTPNHGHWTPIGGISSVARSGNVFNLALEGGGRSLQVSFLSATCFRVRFSPEAKPDYTIEGSPAVVTRDLGPVKLKVVENSSARLVVDTGAMRVDIDLQPYRIRVYRDGQLISADEPSYNLVYIPDAKVVANFKTRPVSAKYCGFGEKAGAQVLKNLFTMTQFNYDNFSYINAPLPPGNDPGPLNPSEALYASIPFMLEINPAPTGDFAGAPYCYGLFFDNGAQSFFNVGSNDYSNMDGKLYFGALFNDLDYYFMLGGAVVDVLDQYTTLTGRGPMPPKYVFGFHQGGYGYYDRAHLEAVADAYRSNRIPCDGLHIDVDFQNNYRTFTHSEMKFPNAAEMMDGLHQKGFKCSTNITPLVTKNELDENGRLAPYAQRQALMQAGALIFNTYAGQGPNRNLFVGRVNYGENNGSNPYQYPPLKPNAQGMTPLGASGNYPDLGRADVRDVWGQQYAHLINDLGMDMIWQDMMCPALDGNVFRYGTFPLDLMINNDVTYVPNGVDHNLYGLFLLMATWNGLNKLRADRRNFIIARGGYAGMHRYAALWTGDSASSWDFLAINVPEVLNIGLSGVPISGCDIGGFANGSGSTSGFYVENGQVKGGITNYELLTRWMQVGSFLPWYRNHYNGYTKEFQEPYRYGEPVPTNCRKYVELRYRMLQIYYDAMYEWTQTGMPIARALFLNDPGDPAVYDHLADQFFVGKNFLVAPILFQAITASPPRAAARDIYLPAGSEWYGFADNQAPLSAAVAGGTTVIDYHADLDLVPIYVRAGAILPMRSVVEQYVGELKENPLDITVYPGPDDDYLLYQDDGLTTEAETAGAYRTTRIGHRTVSGGRSVRLERLVDAYTPPESYYTIRFLATARPNSVTLGSNALPDAHSASGLAAATSDVYFWDAGLETTVVKVFDTLKDVTVTVRT
ncbi:MAG: DUF4968 domain-containing protein [Rhodospirillales bacterium]|nr:DUF4968 domain-containing protein [Rhodospirillales bacterium]